MMYSQYLPEQLTATLHRTLLIYSSNKLELGLHAPSVLAKHHQGVY